MQLIIVLFINQLIILSQSVDCFVCKSSENRVEVPQKYLKFEQNPQRQDNLFGGCSYLVFPSLILAVSTSFHSGGPQVSVGLIESPDFTFALSENGFLKVTSVFFFSLCTQTEPQEEFLFESFILTSFHI